MASKHYTDEELIEQLYGLGSSDGHLDLCPECRGRFGAIEERRKLVAGHQPYVTPGFLAEQRHAVLARIVRPAAPRVFWKAATAFAGMAVIVVGFLSYHPANVPATQPEAVAAVSDAQLYADISTVVETPEPMAATPIRGLFEEKEAAKATQ